MIRINSCFLNDIFYNIKKKINKLGYRSNFGAELIPHWTIAKTILNQL